MNDLTHTEIAAPNDSVLSDSVKKGLRQKVVRASYDAAKTTDDNSRHWLNADSLSADGSLSADIRSIIRNRSRYEVSNNSYARGIVTTLANDMVGTGPRLQLLTEDVKGNSKVESLFMAWAAEIKLAQKLRTMRMAKATDGEAFAVLSINRNLSGPIKLDLTLVEADRVVTPWKMLLKEGSNSDTVDGIEYDEFGNPSFYYVSKKHPGDSLAGLDDYTKIPAKSMIHWFNQLRPGQHRGVSEIVSALPLFAQLRRYTLAVIAAAETAADFAAVMFTRSPANQEAAEVVPMDVVELESRMATTLPEGWELGQIKAEQPTTAYVDFRNAIINESGRCVNMPFNIAAGNSAGYNYASGRLDHQVYHKSLVIEQGDAGGVVLDPIVSAWFDEAILVTGLLPMKWRTMLSYPHLWFWDGQMRSDPARESKADATDMETGQVNLSILCAKRGLDSENVTRQRYKEKRLELELELELAKLRTTIAEAEPKSETEPSNAEK